MSEHKMKWDRIEIDMSELAIKTVLRCGQSFRWIENNDVWSICMHNRVLFLKQDPEYIYFRSEGPGNHISDYDLVSDYFNLNIKLNELYGEWVNKDKRFVNVHKGVRILRQDPWETVCAFICSSNNNIKRISKMVSSLCTEFGTHVHTIDGIDCYDFPTPEQLHKPNTESRLRELGFGYRARYIAETAELAASKPNISEFFNELRSSDAEYAVTKLMEFPGVGPKVADCISLMSLDKHAIVPLDTHMFKIATRDYKISVKNNKQGYTDLQNKFRNIWGEYAGWAHSVLFAGDLRDLQKENQERDSELKRELKTEEEVAPTKRRRRTKD